MYGSWQAIAGGKAGAQPIAMRREELRQSRQARKKRLGVVAMAERGLLHGKSDHALRSRRKEFRTQVGVEGVFFALFADLAREQAMGDLIGSA